MNFECTFNYTILEKILYNQLIKLHDMFLNYAVQDNNYVEAGNDPLSWLRVGQCT